VVGLHRPGLNVKEIRILFKQGVFEFCMILKRTFLHYQM